MNLTMLLASQSCYKGPSHWHVLLHQQRESQARHQATHCHVCTTERRKVTALVLTYAAMPEENETVEESER